MIVYEEMSRCPHKAPTVHGVPDFASADSRLHPLQETCGVLILSTKVTAVKLVPVPVTPRKKVFATTEEDVEE